MEKKLVIPFFVFLCTVISVYSQNVGIGPDTTFVPHSSAIFELKTNDKGFLFPRVTQAQRNAIGTVGNPPADWLFVVQTDATAGFYYYDSLATQWKNISQLVGGGSGGSGWELTGNSGTTAGTNFIGTTDAQGLVFKTDNNEAFRITETGNIAIGTLTPVQRFELHDGNFLLNNGGIYLTNDNNTASPVVMYEPSNEGVNYTHISAAAQDSNIIYKLPAGQALPDTLSVLVNDGTGDLEWGRIGDIVPFAWKLTGNTGTTAGTDFIGTTDAQGLVFKTDNNEAFRITATGNIGVGITNPIEKFEINNGNFSLRNDNTTAGYIRLFESSDEGTNYTQFSAAAQSEDITYKLPPAQALSDTSISVLVNDGSGDLEWQTMEVFSGEIRYNVLTVITQNSYDATLDDTHIIVDNSNAATTIYLPTTGNIAGKQYFIKKTTHNHEVYICPGVGRQIDGYGGIQMDKQRDWIGVMIVCDGDNWYIMNAYVQNTSDIGGYTGC